MPRLTFEALMAPGGLLDAGSRLTQTLIETPFKREQLRQGIREQELGRAEQRGIRAEAFAREDKVRTDQNKREDERVGKAGRIDYYKGRVNAAEARMQTAMKEASDAFEKKLMAKATAAGGEPEQMEIVKQAVEIVKSKLANPSLVASLKDDPKLIERTMDEAMAAVNKQLGGAGVLTSEALTSVASSSAAALDPQMMNEIDIAMKESANAWELYRKEVGAAETRVNAREFMQNNGMGTESYRLGGNNAPAAAPGAAPAEPIVTQADAGVVDPNETDVARRLRIFQEKTNAERTNARNGTVAPAAATGAPVAEPSGIPFEERTRTMSRQLQGQVPAVADATRQQADMLAEAQRIMAGGRGTAGGGRDKPYMGAVKALNTGAVPDPKIAEIVDAIAKQTNLSPDARAVFDDIVAKEFGAQNFQAAAAATVPGRPLDPAAFQGLGTSGGPTQNPNTWFTRENQLTHRNDVNMALIQAPLMDAARRANIIAASARTRKPIPDMVAYNPFAR